MSKKFDKQVQQATVLIQKMLDQFLAQGMTREQAFAAVRKQLNR